MNLPDYKATLTLSTRLGWRPTFWKNIRGCHTRNNGKNTWYDLAETKMKVRAIMKTKGLLEGLLTSRLNNHLCMRNLASSWVPLFSQLTTKANPGQLGRSIWRYSTVIWTNFCAISQGDSAPNNAKVGLSANKVVTVFWEVAV